MEQMYIPGAMLSSVFFGTLDNFKVCHACPYIIAMI
jgi:hypothetical protein